MDLKNKKILVTGAGGFIGSHLVESLVKMGADVRAFLLYNSFNSWDWLEHSPNEIKNKIEVVSGDIRDPYGVKRAMHGCEIVFHLAALIAIPFSYSYPETYVDTNIKGTLNLLQAARELEVKKFIHTSTSEVYGTAKYVPIDEQHPLQGQSPYSATKIAADNLAMSFHYSFNLPVSIIRPFNTYGPRQSARAVVPTIITQLFNGQKTLKLGSLDPTRDFNYVKDTVNGFIAIAESEKSIGEVINIGSNYEVSIGETARLIGELMGTEVSFVQDETRFRPKKSEVNRLLASNFKATQLLNWKPEYGGIDGFKRGLSETIAWFSKAENLKAYKADIYNI